MLLAEACNIGLEPVVRPDDPALTRGRLSWVQQNYIRAETLTRANAWLVDMPGHDPFGTGLGRGGGRLGGWTAVRGPGPDHQCRPNRKYFDAEPRGHLLQFHLATNSPASMLSSSRALCAIRCTSSMACWNSRPAAAAWKSWRIRPGSVTVVFGLFWLLGYQFSPRLADIGEARFWRLDPKADYGVLNGIARSRVNTKLILRNWDDLLRVAGSLHQGTVSASELMRSLLRSKRPSTLARAICALGRIPKTLYLLAYIDDESYRRRILTQLNRGESRHSVARAVFHGQRGELRQRYREGQEDQLGALGLVVNAIVLWNTLYMEAALTQMRAEGLTVQAADQPLD